MTKSVNIKQLVYIKTRVQTLKTRFVESWSCVFYKLKKSATKKLLCLLIRFLVALTATCNFFLERDCSTPQLFRHWVLKNS